ncbi:YqaA family protein [Pseudoalteromonas sp. T1lg23B]|uniref:YqaA family protein n=1 Tax=Pseudoalteromonas sp. T1lg23B TaxID=2077097 RepID=UPI000CF6B6A7|nr:YqaA family protein [Pseudoalteromonas sp. T1lg23B]
MWIYSGLFISALSSATLLPGSSEVLLSGLAMADNAQFVILWAVATFGNVLGSCINYWLGINLLRFESAKWFPVSPQKFSQARLHFSRYGTLSLLFSWVPVIGDPLTLLAGVFKVRKRIFLPLVLIGKGIRYAVVITLAVGVEQLF